MLVCTNTLPFRQDPTTHRRHFTSRLGAIPRRNQSRIAVLNFAVTIDSMTHHTHATYAITLLEVLRRLVDDLGLLFLCTFGTGTNDLVGEPAKATAAPLAETFQ